jgi:hypothetical protein
LSEGNTCPNDETSSDRTSDGNHGYVSSLEPTGKLGFFAELDSVNLLWMEAIVSWIRSPIVLSLQWRTVSVGRVRCTRALATEYAHLDNDKR